LTQLFATLLPNSDVRVTGRATGTLRATGALYGENAEGERAFSAANLRGTAQFTQLVLQIADVQLAATDPLIVQFSPNEIVFDKTQFTGPGTNIVFGGSAALGAGGRQNFSIDGDLNLRVLNGLSPNVFLAGAARVGVRVGGSFEDPRLTGTARWRARLLDAGDGRAPHGAEHQRERALHCRPRADRLADRHARRWPHQRDGRRAARRIHADAVSPERARRERHRAVAAGHSRHRRCRSHSARHDAGADSLRPRQRAPRRIHRRHRTGRLYQSPPRSHHQRRRRGRRRGGLGANLRLDLRVEGRDALVVRNNLADVVGSLAVQIRGSAEEPIIGGRVTVTRGTLNFRNDRYE
jgi:hypothetical protein